MIDIEKRKWSLDMRVLGNDKWILGNDNLIKQVKDDWSVANFLW